MEKKLIVGISGASGAPIAVTLLKALQKTDIQTHLIVTNGGCLTLAHECETENAASLADVVYNNDEIGAAPASGSFKTMGMVVVPCSMKTVAGINCGYSDNLLLRAADVTLKERRRLVLVTRECPLSPIHLRNMSELGQAGAIILPPVLSFYQKPQTLQDMTNHIVGKILDQFDIPSDMLSRWEGLG